MVRIRFFQCESDGSGTIGDSAHRPSGCGKSTFLRTLNRMNDLIEGTRCTGEILIQGQNIMDSAVDVVLLRKHVGMVFQKSTPFPKSIFDNVAYGLAWRVSEIVRCWRSWWNRA